MYKCENCGHLFEEGEEKRWTEMHGFEGGNGEQRSGCPLCGESYEEIEPCKICGTYEHDVNETYCEECKIDVQKRFQTFIKTNFTKEERELLNELYDGEPI